jgi:SAM-dependent methyltransferase
VYEALLGDARDPAVEARAAIRELAAQGVVPPASVLELCAGASPHGDRLARAGYRVVALDLARGMLASASPACPVPADVRAVPVATGAASAALLAFEAWTLFADNADLLALLAELARVLRPGGVALVDLEEPGWATGEAAPRAPRTYARERTPGGMAAFIEHPIDWRRGVQRFEIRGPGFRAVDTLRLTDPNQVALVAEATGAFRAVGQVVQSRDPLRLFVVLRRLAA